MPARDGFALLGNGEIQERSLIAASPSSASRSAPDKSFKKSLAACKTLAIDKKVVNRRDSLEYDSAGTMQVGLLRDEESDADERLRRA